MTKPKTIRETFKENPKENPIDIIINKYNIDRERYYVDSFKITTGSWDTSAKKRDTDLSWHLDEQIITDSKGKVKSKIDKQQFMEGYTKHFPEFIVNENETFKIEVTFKPFPIEFDILDSFKELIKDMPSITQYSPIQIITGSSHKDLAAEISTYDSHFAKLAWEKETGYRNYDLDIAVTDYKYVSEEQMDLIAPHKPKIIYYVIGQDMYHIDNMKGNTTHGDHALDVDGRITKVHNKIFHVTRDNVYGFSKIAPVEIIWIPGNHDYLASYMLAFALNEHFRNDPNIIVDLGEVPNKARLWGNLLVGWTHRIVGKHNTWANELAQAFPDLWGKSKFREWHSGDQHKKVNTKTIPVFTSGGVLCRQLTALSPVDRWHSVNLFTDAVPGGESFLWTRDAGIIANFTSWIGQYEDARTELLQNKIKRSKNK